MIDEAARRGRVASCPDPAGGPVAAFAHRLWALKRSAGDPSYDRMRTELGALASKSALSAAARGQRLPSWDTTWEFVRVLAVGVLGEHEEEVRARWRADWERVRDGVANPAPAPRRWRRPVVVAAVATAVLAIGVVAGAALLRDPEPAAPAPAALSPLVPGDESEFAGDVTVPDGTVVPTGARFVKTWEFRNTGTVPWVDRSLRREGGFGPGDGCQTPAVVPVPDTPPGRSARVSVEVRAPDEPGYCQVYFKMTDSAGRLLLPGTRAAYFFVRVAG
ncbi:NBR1-Ig-like domain-containing protein [Amycolatopsis thermoflava]|uniref:NBR1-Ig-like domain-containing protein n=1 Tax=Amycolatopsis thermoflava TaxID=84480 RepID=UPI001E567023|nr:NBR1-Ig-like domain-containing protein [Amycolatopsis thermoflava]